MKQYRRNTGRARGRTHHIAAQVVVTDVCGISEERLDLRSSHCRIGHPLIEVTHQLGFGYRGQLPNVRERLGHIAIAVCVVGRVSASVGDEIAQTLLLTSGDARLALPGSSVRDPRRRQKSSADAPSTWLVVHGQAMPWQPEQRIPQLVIPFCRNKTHRDRRCASAVIREWEVGNPRIDLGHQDRRRCAPRNGYPHRRGATSPAVIWRRTWCRDNRIAHKPGSETQGQDFVDRPVRRRVSAWRVALATGVLRPSRSRPRRG